MKTSRPIRRRRLPLSEVVIAIPETPGASEETLPILNRPDGYYWQAPDGRQAFGPFESHEQACADRDRYDEERPASSETLQQAESATGIADWIDAETGEPAEGLSRPRLPEP